jgi:hypothetical protein
MITIFFYIVGYFVGLFIYLFILDNDTSNDFQWAKYLRKHHIGSWITIFFYWIHFPYVLYKKYLYYHEG